MKNAAKILTACAIVITGTAVFAGSPHRDTPKHHPPKKESGVTVAANIVRLVGSVLGKPAVVICPQAKPCHHPAPPPPPPRKPEPPRVKKASVHGPHRTAYHSPAERKQGKSAPLPPKGKKG